MLSLSHPNLVFTVTGKCVLSTTALVNRTIKSTSFKTPAPAPLVTTFFTGQPKLMSTKGAGAGVLKDVPAPLVTTFFTGQPKLMSTKSGFTASTIFADIA